ncbi:MAG: hypothetical protein AAGA96_13775 [Verrucomicrobiota bacterium]
MERFFQILLLVAALLAPLPILAEDRHLLPEASQELLNKLDGFRVVELQKFQEAIGAADKSGMTILAEHVKRETKRGNLDAAVALKEIGSLTLLEELDEQLPEDSRALIEKFKVYRDGQADQMRRLIQEKEAAVARVLDSHLKAASDEGELEIAVALRNEISKLASPEAVKESAKVSTVPARARLSQLGGEGGKIRVAGFLTPHLSAAVRELESLPMDFVEVHAYRTAWIGIRANGNCFVVGLNREMSEIITNSDFRFVLVGKSYDPFCYTRGMVHRLVNWDLNRPSKLQNPIAIAGGHSTGLIIDSRGRANNYGGVSVELVAPPESMRKDLKALYASKHSFMVVNKDHQAAVWDMREGKLMSTPSLEGVEVMDADPGHEHYVLLDQSGGVQSIDVKGGSASPKVIPDGLRSGIRVKAGGSESAVQLADGTWRSWGESRTLSGAVEKAGAAWDLDLYEGEGASYVIWIEAPLN